MSRVLDASRRAFARALAIVDSVTFEHAGNVYQGKENHLIEKRTIRVGGFNMQLSGMLLVPSGVMSPRPKNGDLITIAGRACRVAEVEEDALQLIIGIASPSP